MGRARLLLNVNLKGTCVCLHCLQKHMEMQTTGEGATPTKSKQQQIAEELMAVRLREAESLAELKGMKQKVMELETQVRVCVLVCACESVCCGVCVCVEYVREYWGVHVCGLCLLCVCVCAVCM